tara:strand:+ start:107 stop:517 length:411 start_codon:yes stop_codon:yes gene_type:complete
MSSIFNNKELKASVTSLEGELAKATSEFEELKASSGQELASYSLQLEQAAKDLKLAGDSLIESEAKLAEVEAKQEDFDGKVEAAAMVKAAAIGHPAPIQEDKLDTDAKAVLQAEYKALPAGEARAKFRSQNASLFL